MGAETGADHAGFSRQAFEEAIGILNLIAIERVGVQIFAERYALDRLIAVDRPDGRPDRGPDVLQHLDCQ